MWNFNNEKNLEWVESSVWFLLTAYINSKIWEEKYKFKGGGGLKWKGTELKTLGNSQPIHIAKNEKLCSGKNTKGVAAQSFNTEIMDLISYLSRNQEQRWDYTRTRGNIAGLDERGQR